MIWNRLAKKRKGGIKAMQISSDVMKLKKSSLFITSLSRTHQGNIETRRLISENGAHRYAATEHLH
jgi:hypothetical protein